MEVTVAAEDNTFQFSQEKQATADHRQQKPASLQVNFGSIDEKDLGAGNPVSQGLSVHA
jgi:hypothetical protein